MSKIFIVEDDLTLRGELIKLLHTHKHECDFTDDFEHAIDDVLKAEPDLLLLDVNLPYFDGYHVCRAIREQSKPSHHHSYQQKHRNGRTDGHAFRRRRFYRQTLQSSDFIG